MVKIENQDEITARLETAKYSAGRPLSIEDLIKASGTESRIKTVSTLDSIIKKTKIIMSVFRSINCFILVFFRINNINTHNFSECF